MPTSRTKLGNWGDGLVRQMLQGKGYAILSTNYRCQWGAIYIVAQEGAELILVEVRTRSSSGTPEEPVSQAKVCRLVATAQDYMQSLGDDLVS